jgi:carboxymethylenebutenolidase
MIETEIQLETSDGQLDAFVCHPEEDGPHPAVIFYMDAPAIREELRDMVRRLASAGYYVMLPNLYYRIGTEGNYGYDLSRLREDPAEHQKMSAAMATLSNARIVEDTAFLLAHLRSDPAANDASLGCVGYCMSGPFVISVCAAYPADFSAGASYHGVKMVTDKPDSPHLCIPAIKAEIYIGFAENDTLVDKSDWQVLADGLSDAEVTHRVEIYPEVGHGFVFPQRAFYERAAAERHWERLHALFHRRLDSSSS